MRELPPEEAVTSADFESACIAIVSRALNRSTRDPNVQKEGVSLAYALAEAAEARVADIQAEYRR